jgi:chorismate synthase
MIECIDRARARGDTVGGVVEVEARGACPGLGSYAQYDRRLDARIGSAMLSIPSVKGAALGDAFDICRRAGSRAQDEIRFRRPRGWFRPTNRCGGIEAGISNGSAIVVRLAVKPVPTLGRPLRSADLISRRPVRAFRERADACVVPAVGIIAEAMLAWVLTDCLLEKFGSDALRDIRAGYRRYLRRIRHG